MEQQETNNQSTLPKLSRRLFFQESMNAGAKIGLVFVLQALSLLLFASGLIGSLIYLASFVAIPILLVVYANRHRDQYHGGEIRYIQAVNFMLWTYLFANLISAVTYFVVFYFLFQSPSFAQAIDQSANMTMILFKDDPEVKNQLLLSISQLTPRSMTVQMTSFSLFLGMIYIYIAAIFVKRP